MELALLVVFMVVTFVVMIGMTFVFKDWLKQRNDILSSDENGDRNHSA